MRIRIRLVDAANVEVKSSRFEEDSDALWATIRDWIEAYVAMGWHLEIEREED